MTIFLVQLAESDRITLRNNVDAMVVSAADAANAKAACKGKFSGDASTAAWEAATVTTLADVASNAANALVGWRFNVAVTSPAGALVVNVTVTGDATTDTLDEVGTALAVALNATTPIAGAAYDTATQTLKVAETTDGLGDHTLSVKVYAPLVSGEGGQVSENFPIPGFVGAIVHQGVAAAVLSVVFPADTYVVPRVLATVQAR